ncbi:hypothetical protein BK665_22175 [Pseudomonas frederiksbergensis]|uniref:Uncharacterized protein n=1 Tax=Pseudomonas frederiksbergensis TaxID=104087 RepID=A0A423KBH3_9PSED|nr:hypothetical protein BK665_22175 [Pseudomonas frederiksbergensis]
MSWTFFLNVQKSKSSKWDSFIFLSLFYLSRSATPALLCQSIATPYKSTSHKTYPATITIKSIDKLLQQRRFQFGRIAFINCKLIQATKARLFFSAKAFLGTCCSYQDCLGSNVLD